MFYCKKFQTISHPIGKSSKINEGHWEMNSKLSWTWTTHCSIQSGILENTHDLVNDTNAAWKQALQTVRHSLYHLTHSMNFLNHWRLIPQGIQKGIHFVWNVNQNRNLKIVLMPMLYLILDPHNIVLGEISSHEKIDPIGMDSISSLNCTSSHMAKKLCAMNIFSHR